MLSSVSKIFDKSFTLGFLLPALLGVFAYLQVFGCPSRFSAYCTISAHDPFANLTYVALLVYVLAILLLSTNYIALRIFEGYSPPTMWLWWLKDWHVKRFRRLTDQRLKYLAEGRVHDASVIRQELFASYPTFEQHILPTAFGNVLRAFEVYSKDVYGADAIPIWPRLSGVIPKSFQDAISDAKSQVDLFVNVSVLSASFGVSAWLRIAMDMWSAHRFEWPSEATEFAWAGGAAFVVAYVAYRWATVQAGAWGEVVRAAFDLYLPALGKQLGYTLPSTESGRRNFWVAFSKLTLYRRQFGDGDWIWAGAEAPKSEAPTQPSESSEKAETGDESDSDAANGDGKSD